MVLNRVLPDIDLQQALEDVSSSLGDFTYVLVGLGAFLETGAFVGLVLPGETVVILGGAVAGQGETSIVLTIGVVWAARPGRRLGELPAGAQAGPRVPAAPRARGCGSRRERFARVEDYFSRHGGKTIVIGRFIGLVRALAPFIAGSSGMRYGYYLPFSVLGTGLWAADLRADRLLRLAEPRRGGARRRPGHAPVRDRGRRDRRDRGRGPLPARSQRTGSGWWRGWSDAPRFVRCSRRGAGWRHRRASCGPG